MNVGVLFLATATVFARGLASDVAFFKAYVVSLKLFLGRLVKRTLCAPCVVEIAV